MEATRQLQINTSVAQIIVNPNVLGSTRCLQGGKTNKNKVDDAAGGQNYSDVSSLEATSTDITQQVDTAMDKN